MTSPTTPHSPAEQIEVDAEVRRLAKLLDLAPEELSYLGEVGAAELRVLRGQVTSALFDGQAALARIAATTRVIPGALVASIAEKIFGPTLAARIAGLVDPDRAVDIAARLPVPFLADVAVQLDPRRVATILAQIPSDTVAEVTGLLITREEWVAMGTFLAYLPATSVAAAMERMDAQGMLQVALVLDDKTRLAEVWALAGDARLAEVGEVAEAEGLSEQLAALAVYLTPAQAAALQR